jgi:hypothetical protein
LPARVSLASAPGHGGNHQFATKFAPHQCPCRSACGGWWATGAARDLDAP